MKKNILVLLTSLLVGIIPISLLAQIDSDITITATYQGQSIPSVLQSIESNHPIQFYYKESELPQKSITATFEEAKL